MTSFRGREPPTEEDICRLTLGDFQLQPFDVPFTELEVLGVRVVENQSGDRGLRVHHVAFGQFHVQVGGHLQEPEKLLLVFQPGACWIAE